MDAFLDDALAISRRGFGLERVSWLVGGQGGAGVGRHVLQMDDRTAARTPGGEQLGNALLRLRVVPSPPRRGVEPLLDVEDQQDLRIRQAPHGSTEPPTSGSGVQTADGTYRSRRWEAGG